MNPVKEKKKKSVRVLFCPVPKVQDIKGLSQRGGNSISDEGSWKFTLMAVLLDVELMCHGYLTVPFLQTRGKL